MLRIREGRLGVDRRDFMAILGLRHAPLLAPEALRRSASESGAFEILCRGCAEQGYFNSECIGLRPFRVTHAGDRIEWVVETIDPERTVRFEFHAPQVCKEIETNLKPG